MTTRTVRHLPLLLTLLLSVPSLAQDEAPEGPSSPMLPRRDPGFGETLDVLVVNIETVVTDKQGNRVLGLTREDFRLIVDGEEIPIDYFTEIRDGFAQPGGLLEGASGDIESVPPEPMATNYLVFVDDFFAIGAQRNLVLNGLAEQLSTLGAKDRVAVAAYDGHRARMLVDWTGDPSRIRQGLSEAKKRDAGGAKRRAEARMFRPQVGTNIDGEIDGSQSAGVAGSFFNSGSTLDAYFPLLSRQIDRLVGAAAATLRGSLPPPGRKVALLVAGGWASGPLFEPFTLVAGPGVAGRRVLDRQDDILKAGLWYRPLVDTANLLGYTLYPIDAPGAGWGGPGVTSSTIGTGFSNSERNVEFTLKQLAYETGGRPLLNGLRAEALETAVEDTRSYYWLGFSAARQGTGLHHDVEVEVLRSGMKTRSRESFVDMSRREEAVMTVEAGLILGDGEDMGSLEVAFGTLIPGAQRRTIEVPIVVEIPFEDLEMLPVDGKLVAMFEVSLGARDKRDVVSEIHSFPVQMDMIEPPPPGSSARFPIQATVRKERHDFVVTVRDSVGGGVFIRRIVLDPKSIKKSTPRAADL